MVEPGQGQYMTNPREIIVRRSRCIRLSINEVYIIITDDCDVAGILRSGKLKGVVGAFGRRQSEVIVLICHRESTGTFPKQHL